MDREAGVGQVTDEYVSAYRAAIEARAKDRE
jgi:hypothetical protein